MNPYAKGNSAYKQAQVTTQDQGTLILMLYDGCVRFLKTSLVKMEANDIEGTHANLVRAKNIISELISSLDQDTSGELGQSLVQLYTYMYNKLIDANINKNAAHIEEVINLMAELRDGWQAVIKPPKANPHQIRNINQGKPVPRGAAGKLSIKG